MALDQIVFHWSDEVTMHHNVLIGFVVEEVIAAGILVGILVRDALKQNAVHRVVRCHAQVENFLCVDAANRHLHVGGHARRSLELVTDHDADFVVVTERVSFAEIDDGSASHVFDVSWGGGYMPAERRWQAFFTAILSTSQETLCLASSRPK